MRLSCTRITRISSNRLRLGILSSRIISLDSAEEICKEGKDEKEDYDGLSVCDVDDLIDEIVYRGDMECMIKEVARRCDIEDVINSFKQKEIEEWLDNHAYEYDYTKVED